MRLMEESYDLMISCISLIITEVGEFMLEKLKTSLVNAPIVKKGEYNYFVHPITNRIHWLNLPYSKRWQMKFKIW